MEGDILERWARLHSLRPMERVVLERQARLNSLRSLEGVVVERGARPHSLRPMEGGLDSTPRPPDFSTATTLGPYPKQIQINYGMKSDTGPSKSWKVPANLS
jgi:hypothetical protein